MLIDDIRQYLSKSYQAGATLRKMGIRLDNISTGSDIGDLLGILVGFIETKADRNADLTAVIEDLLEQHERQIDMEACALWQSYPDKFPEWDRAWKNAREVLDNG